MLSKRWLTIVGLIAFGVLARFAPHAPNFSPLAALALFSATYMRKFWQALIVPIGALLISDAILGFYPDMPIVYASFALITILGLTVKSNKSIVSFLGASVGSSVLFFVLTNFGVWWLGRIYPLNAAGLGACFLAAIPFFQNTVTSTLLFGAVLFGAQEMLDRHVFQLAPHAQSRHTKI